MHKADIPDYRRYRYVNLRYYQINVMLVWADFERPI